MKRKFFAIIFMAVCASGMHAQTEDVDTVNINVEVPSEELSGDNEADSSPKSSKKPKVEKKTSIDNYEYGVASLQKFNSMAMANQKTDVPNERYFPLDGKKSKYHRVQKLYISFMGGSDNDGGDDTSCSAQNFSSDDYEDQQENFNKGNFGISIDYSFGIYPGAVDGDSIKINKYGFGYDLGLVAAFDKQDHYGITCDFLLKAGIETGYGHKMGIGFDFLGGTGKSGGMSYYLDDDLKDWDDIDSEPYSKWCLKYGAQLWIRTSLLSTGIKNSNIRLFIRYVNSLNPGPEQEPYEGGVKLNNWLKESWQYGLQLCYEF
jgi:hypothetical protein